jgi:hypothetical protein
VAGLGCQLATVSNASNVLTIPAGHWPRAVPAFGAITTDPF